MRRPAALLIALAAIVAAPSYADPVVEHPCEITWSNDPTGLLLAPDEVYADIRYGPVVVDDATSVTLLCYLDLDDGGLSSNDLIATSTTPGPIGAPALARGVVKAGGYWACAQARWTVIGGGTASGPLTCQFVSS